MSGSARAWHQCASRRTLGRRLQNGANNRGRQFSALRLQAGLRSYLILLDACPRFFHLSLRPGPRFGHRRRSRLQRQLPARFLTLEYRHARFPQALLIFRGSGLSLGDVGARLFDRALGPATPFGQHFNQRFVHDRGVNAEQQDDQDNGRHGPEQ